MAAFEHLLASYKVADPRAVCAMVLDSILEAELIADWRLAQHLAPA